MMDTPIVSSMIKQPMEMTKTRDTVTKRLREVLLTEFGIKSERNKTERVRSKNQKLTTINETLNPKLTSG